MQESERRPVEPWHPSLGEPEEPVWKVMLRQRKDACLTPTLLLEAQPRLTLTQRDMPGQIVVRVKLR